MPRIIIIADDLSGAADCAVASMRSGLSAVVALSDWEHNLTTDVSSIDCDTRNLSEQAAADQVTRVLLSFATKPDLLLFKKLDSTLRGNFAAELAAMLTVRRAALPDDHPIAVVMAPAFPEGGRTTMDGQQFVHGRPLHESEMWTREGKTGESLHIPSMLAMVGLTCVNVGLDATRSGMAALHHLMETSIRTFDVLVCDAETEEDLRTIARASAMLRRHVIWAGSAGLACHLPHAVGLFDATPAVVHHGSSLGPTLIVVGSMSSVSRRQVQHLCQESPVSLLSLDPLLLLDGPHTRSWSLYSEQLATALRGRKDVVVMLEQGDRIDASKSRLLSKALGAMLAPCVNLVGALVASGGETARTILDAWEVKSLRMAGEIEPGIPFGRTEGWSRELNVVTKAGAFGNPDTLLRCWKFLRNHGNDAGDTSPMLGRIQMISRPVLAITMGDAAGVGPEIIVKTLAHAELYHQCRPLVIGDANRLREAIRIVGSQLEVRSLELEQINEARYVMGVIDCIDLKLIPKDLPWGKLSAVAGDAAFRYMEIGAKLALNGDVQAICTAPLNKEALHAGGHKYPGHTEMLAALTGTDEVSMMLSTPKMRVIHVTTHIGLIDAIAKIEPGLVERTIMRGFIALQKAGIAQPRIGVCGINPHAGENGLFGRGEEAEKIEPAISVCRAKGLNVEGPLPADTLFFRAQRGDFDLVVAMYHDQGHGPVKVLGLESGVNITIGLPVVRTSVDHGTAFDIAGTGRADESSLIQAILQAIQLAAISEGAATSDRVARGLR